MRRRSNWGVMAATTVVMVAGWAVWLDARRGVGAQAATAPVVSWDAFSADVSFRQAFLKADGTPHAVQPPLSTFRLERTRSSRGWRTVVTLRRIDKVSFMVNRTMRAVDNPHVIARMEVDGDGLAPRLYNADGRLVALPTDADRRLLKAPVPADMTPPDWNALATRVAATALVPAQDAWIDSVIATPDRRVARRQAIERSFGPPRGRVAGLDQYVATTGDVTREMLVNAELAVPIEINTAQGGRLTTRATFSHEPRANGVFVRRYSRGERVFPEAGGVRVITDVEMTNVTTGSAR